jgi:hypothetical protein
MAGAAPGFSYREHVFSWAPKFRASIGPERFAAAVRIDPPQEIAGLAPYPRCSIGFPLRAELT